MEYHAPMNRDDTTSILDDQQQRATALPPARKLKVFASACIALLVGLLVSGTTVLLYETNRMHNYQRAVADITRQVADDIHDSLNRSLSATYALAAVIRQNNGTLANFPQLAHEMLGLYHGISSLQLAPNGIVSQIVPLAGNEKAIGHNLLEDTKRNKEALLAVKTRQLTLAGPFELIQGGRATIGRLPIFIRDLHGNERFWGFSIALIRIPEFLDAANIKRITDNGCSFALSRIHPDSGKIDVFARAGNRLASPVQEKIQVPNGEWTLAVEPAGGWYAPRIIIMEGLFIFLTGCIAALMGWWYARQPIVLQQMVDDRTQELVLANTRLQTEIQERHLAQAALTASENKLRSIFASLTDVILILDQEGRYLEIAPTSTKRLFLPPDELLGKSVTEVFPPEQADFFIATIRDTLASGKVTMVDYALTIGNDLVWFSGIVSPLSATTVVWSARDITQRKQSEEERLNLEKQMLHSQKLESLGVLAGGIAHDFNNILTTIIGNADLALMRLSPESPIVDNLQQIEQAASRAADLARQMLAYSGKGTFIIEELDLNRLVEEMGHMLEVSISKKAILRYSLCKPLPAVTADATQLRQILMNLVINASEAIGDQSGTIAITTGVLTCSDTYGHNNELSEQIPAGEYVYLEVSDTGCGMSKETLTKIFDPFFTTKFTGRGLGMAAVLGIVHGHRGAIKVYSEVGKGSTFKVMLPASSMPAGRDVAPEENGNSWCGSGKVLLIDDEENIRSLGSEMLKELGYEVITAADGREGIARYQATDAISFVILDLTMPHMDGEQCFRELRQLNPAVKVIMSSGFNEQEVTGKFVGKGLAGFIQKPYRLSTLREVVRHVEMCDQTVPSVTRR
jgi:PAS domain S-box-containing protein